MKGKDPIDYTAVLFATHTQENGTPRELLWKRVESYYRRLSYFTGAHILAVRGYEEGRNSHKHSIVSVADDELVKFLKRFHLFDAEQVPGCRWSTIEQLAEKTNVGRWRMETRAFDQNKLVDAYRYTLVKHVPVFPEDSRDFYCPRKYHRCRKGRCTHIPANK